MNVEKSNWLNTLIFFHQKEGDLISFNFNKNKNSGIVETTIDDKKIIEVIV